MQDHLQWPSAHVVGHSMGAMIAARMALAAPQRMRSLTLVSATGGGTEAIPFSWTAIKTAIKASRARDPESRASFDLIFHYSPKLLKTKVAAQAFNPSFCLPL